MKMETLVRQIKLWFCEGSSDKVYIVSVYESNGVYLVVAQWGRRGKTLQSQTKGRFTSDWQAHQAYLNLVSQKQEKGYNAVSNAFC
jgi:predicted DNA-binding WGR domain protein